MMRLGSSGLARAFYLVIKHRRKHGRNRRKSRRLNHKIKWLLNHRGRDRQCDGTVCPTFFLLVFFPLLLFLPPLLSLPTYFLFPSLPNFIVLTFQSPHLSWL